MSLKIIPAYNHPQEVGDLFSEYTKMLIDEDPTFQDYLGLQDYEEELKHLEVKYGMPSGRLYLAFWGQKLADCIGLRKMDDKTCEMKRFYVRPEFRGRQIGRILIEKVLADAREIGYSIYMKLDL